MKNNLLLILLFWGTLSFAQTRTIPYIFPVKPGTEEWKMLKSSSETVRVCDIPDSILKSLTTEALIKTSLNYPLLYEVFCANDLQKGIEGVIKNFNGLTELLKRKDAGMELFKIYRSKNPQKITDGLSETQKGLFTFEFTYLELLLSQPQFLSGLNSNEKTELVKESIIKYDNKKNRIDIFGDFGLTTSIFLIAKVLNSENKTSDILKRVPQKDMEVFLATAMYSNPLTLSTIYQAGKSL